ncbi:MAG TPA: flagellar biosynthetic protein FliR [Phycisphaerae bacterium]|nr:flagellar biosynthetic protein FliR [Phycisphaerae bacterium]HNU46170.1 flagellar biosynthetic protein FliR [Phycisphaerae bacterium]
MPWGALEVMQTLPAFALVLVRLSGLMLVAPVFSSPVIPLRVRAALTMVLAAMVFPLVRVQVPGELSLGAVLTGAVAELAVGACIGLSMGLLLVGVELGGMLTGMQAGLGIGEVFDPTLGRDVNLLGQLFNLVLMLLFLGLGGHRALLRALLDSYSAVPLLSFTGNESVVVLFTEVLTAAFVLALRLAAPALIALFLMTTTLAFLSRTMPQLNILTVGFTIKGFVALGVAGLTLGVAGDLLIGSVWEVLDSVRVHFGMATA